MSRNLSPPVNFFFRRAIFISFTRSHVGVLCGSRLTALFLNRQVDRSAPNVGCDYWAWKVIDYKRSRKIASQSAICWKLESSICVNSWAICCRELICSPLHASVYHWILKRIKIGICAINAAQLCRFQRKFKNERCYFRIPLMLQLYKFPRTAFVIAHTDILA